MARYLKPNKNNDICIYGLFDKEKGKVICTDITACAGEPCYICCHHKTTKQKIKEAQNG
jgi:myosin-crossreactive antigen